MEDYLIYRNADDQYKVYRMNKDGSGGTKIRDEFT